MSEAAAARPLPRTLWAALLHPWTWRMAWRDSRTQRQRLIIFSLSIVSGIAALVAIHSLKASVEKGIEKQARTLLGSDLQVSSRQPFTDAQVAQLTTRATAVSRELSFSSMLYFSKADAARLVQVRGIDGGYPFYGRVETQPPDAWQRLRSERGILLEAALLDQFGAKVGDIVKLGSLELPILGAITKGPPSASRFSGFAPEACLRLADLPDTGLLGAASLAFHYLHLTLPPTLEPRKLKEQFRKDFAETTWRFETPDDRRESLGEALNNFQQFLGLIAMVSLVLGAIGVAGAVQAHIARRVTTVAILRCLGCPGDLAFGIYLAQAAVLGAIGAALGAAVGIGLHLGTLAWFRDSLPVAVDPSPEWLVVAQTSAAGFAVCCGFALLPLLRVRTISPGATLREGAALSEPVKRTEFKPQMNADERRWGFAFLKNLRPSAFICGLFSNSALRAWPIYLLLAALLTGVALLNATDWKRALGLVGGLGVAFALLFASAAGLVALARRVVRPSWPYLLRQGISNLHRPHNQTLLFLLSLGLGTFLLLTILLARDLLGQRLTLAQFAESPNLYLIDVQPDQIDGVTALVQGLKLPILESAPMVTMRIASVRGTPVRELEKQHAIPKWVLQREFRSSYRDRLNPTETIVAGQWLTSVPNSNDPNAPVPLSLEAEIANDLHVAIGDEMVLDVQGVPIRARVTSLRKVDWSRFNLNFFMIFPPGVLEAAPGFQVITTRTPAGVSSGELQRTLAKQFANVSVIDLTQILETVRGILEKISRVITVLAGFTVLAGLPIVIGTLLNGRDRRVRESVLLRTLGASAAQVRTILIVEYATLGALSALAGVGLACIANAALALFVFQASPWPAPALLAGAFTSASALAVLGGLALSRGVSRHPPLQILRANG